MTARGRNARASRNFSWKELGSPPARYRQNALRLAESLENLRAYTGGSPLFLISAYRTPSHNADVGGAPQSQHLLALAADIPKGYATEAEAWMAGFHGVGVKDGFAIHVDVRDGPDARWEY